MKITIDGIEFGGQSKVHDWYRLAFPQDKWAIDTLNKGITFQDTYEALQAGVDIYAFLGAVDSIVRERVFDALATMMECSYDHIYYQWLNECSTDKQPCKGRLYEDLGGLRFE